MAGILVGDEDCPIPEIANVFLKPGLVAVMMDEWQRFASALQIPYEFVKKLQFDLQLSKITHSEIVTELLIKWRSRNGNKATTGNLLSIIVLENLVYKEVEDFLRAKIQQNARKWDDLDESSKTKILNYKIRFLGKDQCLNSIKPLLKETDFMDTLKKKMNHEFIQQAIKRNTMKLDNLELPKQLPYYINRKLKWKRKLNPVIFHEPCQDIFVFEDILHHHLSLLAQPEMTDVSGNQLDNLTVRFILLELEGDFEEILKNANVPVHRIKYFDGAYYWNFTAGSLNVIQSHLLYDFEDVSEQELVREHFSTFCSRPHAIVSTSGMGKSVLLGSLAHQTLVEYPERIVLFLEMRSIVQYIKGTEESLSLSSTKDIIASFASTNAIGNDLIRKLLDYDTTRFEVFLDGFDEIPFGYMNLTKKFLACLVKASNIRAHVTSRPHLRDELENTIGVISFDISPFQTNDQLGFLCGFWKTNLNIRNEEKLSSFASIVINDMSSDYVGIPLQCFLMAEVYSREARRYSYIKTECYQINNLSSSVFELYYKFIAMKFENVAEEDRECIKKFHWLEALKLLFPDNESSLLIQQNITEGISQSFFLPESVYAVGIIEAGRIPNSLVFVHRTIAQFMVADLIVEYLKGNQQPGCKVMAAFILDSVLDVCVNTQEIEIDDAGFDWVIRTLVSTNFWKDGSSRAHVAKLTSVLVPQCDLPLQMTMDYNVGAIIVLWKRYNGRHATLDTLLRAFNNLQWTEVVDQLNNTVSKFTKIRAFVHSTICYFLDAHLAKYKNEVRTSSQTKLAFKKFRRTKRAQFWKNSFEQVMVMTRKSYKHFLPVIIDLVWDSENVSLKLCASDIRCRNLLTFAACFGDVELFQVCCDVVDKVGKTKSCEITFTCKRFNDVKFECTPLHHAVIKGNYKLTEYLVNLYKDKVAQMQCLSECTLFDSWQDSPYVIQNKSKIILLLKSIKAPFCLITFRKFLHGCHTAVELFTSFCDMIDYVPDQEDQKYLVRSIMMLIQNEFQLNFFVDWLISKDQVGLIISSDAIFLKMSMLLNILQPQTFSKVYKLSPFDLGCMLKACVGCGRGEEFVRLFVELSGKVNITDSNKWTMLHHAVRYRKFHTIQYLLSVGANVNANTLKGNTPLLLAFVGEECLTNIFLVMDCVQLLVDHGADHTLLAVCQLYKKLVDKVHKDPVIKMQKLEIFNKIRKPKRSTVIRKAAARLFKISVIIFSIGSLNWLKMFDDNLDTMLHFVVFLLTTGICQINYRNYLIPKVVSASKSV